MSLRVLFIGSVILCSSLTSQIQAQAQPVSEQRQVLVAKQQLIQLKKARYALLHVYKPSSHQIRDMDTQIHALSDNPDYQIPLQQQPRFVLARCLADLTKERFLLLHQFKPQSMEVVSIDSRIRILRKVRDELSPQAQKAN